LIIYSRFVFGAPKAGKRAYTEILRAFLMPILNFPLGANFDPRGEVGSYSLGVKFSVCPSIFLNSRECSPLGVNKGVNIAPGGQVHP
jgi:hypothetical protein